MSKKFFALTIAAATLVGSASALADVPGGSGGSGGTTATAGSGGGGTGGTKDKGGGCATTPGGATTSAAMLVGLGFLAAIPALRRRREKKDQAPRG